MKFKQNISKTAIIYTVFFILCLFLMRVVPFLVLLLLFIATNWLLIKKLSHNTKFKLSIVMLSIGIVMLIVGLVNYNLTSQKDYKLEDNIGDTITNNTNKYIHNNSEEIQDQNEKWLAVSIISGFITFEGAIFLLGSGRKQNNKINLRSQNISSNQTTTKMHNNLDIDKNKTALETIEALEKLAELKDKGILTQKEFNAKKKELLNLKEL